MPIVDGLLDVSPRCLDTKECVGHYDAAECVHRWPCGLAATAEVLALMPGSFWSALTDVHLDHHRLCSQTPAWGWLITESVQINGKVVTFTFDCSCNKEGR